MTKKLDLAAIAVTILGIALRVYRLGYTDLWYDESFTAWMSTLPIGNMLRATAGDVHPPLWYLIEMATVNLLGTSETALRLPSLILGCANLWLFYQVGQALGLPQRVNLLALFLLATSPFQIYYSQETRMYQLLQFGVLLTLLAILRRKWIQFTLGGLLMLYTHNLGVLYLATLDLVAFLVTLHDGRGPDQGPGQGPSWRLLSPISSNVVIALGFLPWAWIAIHQAADVENGFWIQRVSLGTVLSTWSSLYWFHAMPDFAMTHAAIIVIGLMTFALWWTGYQVWRGQDRQMLVILLILFLAPQILAAAVSILWRPIYLYRSLIGIAPMMCWLVAYALNSQKRRLGSALVGIPFLILVLGSYYFNPDGQREPVSSWVQIIRQKARSGDVVFHANMASYILFHYYLPEMDNVVWRQANDLSQSLTDETKEAMLMDQIMVDELARVRRAWLVYSINPCTSLHENEVMQSLIETYHGQRIATLSQDALSEASIWLLDLGGAP